MNQSVCVHLEKSDGFSELLEMTGNEVFPLFSFYETSSDAENDFIYAEFLRAMLKDEILSPTEIGWDHLFKAVEFQKKGPVEKKDKEILIKTRTKEESRSGWIINPEIKWFTIDFNQALLYLVSDVWIFEHLRLESENQNKDDKDDVYEGDAAALQLICNFDLQHRIRKYASYPVMLELEFQDKIRSLCRSIDNLSSKTRLKRREEMETTDREMEVKNPPAQNLDIGEKLESSIMELLDLKPENDKNSEFQRNFKELDVHRIISMLNSASPRRSIFLFFQIVEEISDAIGKEDGSEADWWAISDFCQNVWDNRKRPLEYLAYVNAFQDFINPCRKFLESERIENPDRGRDENALRELRQKTEAYKLIRDDIMRESQNTNLDILARHLKNREWIKNRISSKSSK